MIYYVDQGEERNPNNGDETDLLPEVVAIIVEWLISVAEREEHCHQPYKNQSVCDRAVSLEGLLQADYGHLEHGLEEEEHWEGDDVEVVLKLLPLRSHKNRHGQVEA